MANRRLKNQNQNQNQNKGKGKGKGKGELISGDEPLNTCSVCSEEFGNKYSDEYFDKYYNKCIYHCEKTKKNNWILDKYSKKLSDKWNQKLVKLFWKKVDNGIDKIPSKSKIPPLLDYKLTHDLNISNCEILDDFKIISTKNQAHPSINIDLTTLNGKLLIDMTIGQKNHDIYIFLNDNVHQEKIKILGSANFKLMFTNLNVPLIDLSSRKDEIIHKNRYSEINIVNNKSINRIKNIKLKDAIIYGKFQMNKVRLDSFNCSGSIFQKKVEIKESIFNKISFFKNTKFEALCDFYKTEFYCNNFTKTTFEDIVVFTEVTFHKKVDFKFTTFEKLTLFRKTIFVKSVDLIDSIIKEEANFLGIKSDNDKLEKENIENRETARIIKNSFEKENNIIESNKFYALEMQKREEELDDEFINEDKWAILDKIVFKLHNITSEHSQNWFLALRWILLIGLVYSLFKQIPFEVNYSFPFVGLLLGLLLNLALMKDSIKSTPEIKKRENYLNSINILLYFLLVIAFSSSHFDSSYLLNVINPISKPKSGITLDMFIVKVIIAYLIYQFIVAVRQNTRRK